MSMFKRENYKLQSRITGKVWHFTAYIMGMAFYYRMDKPEKCKSISWWARKLFYTEVS